MRGLAFSMPQNLHQRMSRGSIIALALVMLAACTSARAVERQITDFKVRDAAGAEHTPAEWREKAAVVLFFIDTECPVSNGYAPQMRRIAEKYAGRKVATYGVHSEPTTTGPVAAAHAKEYNLPFPIWIDPKQQLAGAAHVRVTPEAVVVSASGKVLYRGRIDDKYSTDGKRRDEPRVHDLEAALDAILAGKDPPQRETKAFGCPLPNRQRDEE